MTVWRQWSSRSSVWTRTRGGGGVSPQADGPDVVGAVGDGDDLQVGPSLEHGVEFSAEHRLQRRLLRLRHACDGQCIEPLALGIVERQRRAARLLIAGRPLRAPELRARAFAFLGSLRVFHRNHHPIKRDRHRHRLVGHHRRLAQRRLERFAVRLPARAQPLGQAVQRALRRRKVCPARAAVPRRRSASSAPPRSSPDAPPTASSAPREIVGVGRIACGSARLVASEWEWLVPPASAHNFACIKPVLLRRPLPVSMHSTERRAQYPRSRSSFTKFMLEHEPPHPRSATRFPGTDRPVLATLREQAMTESLRLWAVGTPRGPGAQNGVAAGRHRVRPGVGARLRRSP